MKLCWLIWLHIWSKTRDVSRESMQQIQWNTKYNISVMLEEELKIFPSGLTFVRMRACMINSAMGHTHANVLSWDFLEVPNKNPLQRLGLPWQRRPGPSRSVDHPTQRCLPFVARRQWAAAGERDRQPEPDTGSSQSYTKQTAELWHFPPCWKTISTVIKGELNRLISSKVTEQPPLPPPHHLSPSSLFLTIPCFSVAWRGGGHQWNAIRSLGG